MEREAQRFDYTVLDKAVEDAKSIYADEVIDDVTTDTAIEVVSELNKDVVVIDIRGEKEPIELSCETLNIPFHQLKVEFKKLAQDKEYLLYCEKGVMSQLHAQYLRDSENRENVRVYRPSL